MRCDQLKIYVRMRNNNSNKNKKPTHKIKESNVNEMQLMLQGSAKINTLPFTLRNKTITIHLKTGPVLLALQSFMITIKGPLHTRTIKRNSSEKCSIVLSV